MQGSWRRAWPAMGKRRKKAPGTIPSSAALLVLTLGAGSLRATAPGAFFWPWKAIFSALLADSYCETLPIDGPPSFRGQSVKYVYKLTIGCQRVNSPIKLLRVPFRVLVLHGKATGSPPCRGRPGYTLPH